MSTVLRYLVCLFALVLIAPASLFARTRHYYIQAEDVVWDFAPSNRNLVHGGEIPEPWTRSHVFPKVRYIGYTDATFSTPKRQPEWLGVLGPIIRAEVGDNVVVHFVFGVTEAVGMHPVATARLEGTITRERITFPPAPVQKFRLVVSSSTTGLPMRTAVPVWAIRVRWSGGITRT